MSSSKPALVLKAGAVAYQHIQQNGLDAAAIGILPGAAGGPKGIGILGLDRAIFGDFLPRAARRRTLVGASVGCWRFAAVTAAGTEPTAIVKNLEKLASLYTAMRFPKGIDAAEVSRRCQHMLEQILGDTPNTLLDNPDYRLVVLADRCRHLFGSDSKGPLLLALVGIVVTNLISRRALGAFMQRTLFYTGDATLPLSPADDFTTHQVALTPDNLVPALMASASIPYVLTGVREIAGAPAGTYRDGGLLDYHLDLPWHTNDIVLYPHFSGRITPGWFDKPLKWRHADSTRQAHTLLVAPSPEYLASLPFGKLPSRDDFQRFVGDDAARERYWHQAIAESERLGDEFLTLVDAGDLGAHLQPL